jgi:hypothetical protein
VSGPLGEANFNLTQYGDGEYKTIKLPLKNCSDPDAFVEIAIKGTAAADKHKSERTHRSSINKKAVEPPPTIEQPTVNPSPKAGGEDDELEKE